MIVEVFDLTYIYVEGFLLYLYYSIIYNIINILFYDTVAV